MSRLRKDYKRGLFLRAAQTPGEPYLNSAAALSRGTITAVSPRSLFLRALSNRKRNFRPFDVREKGRRLRRRRASGYAKNMLEEEDVRRGEKKKLLQPEHEGNGKRDTQIIKTE